MGVPAFLQTKEPVSVGDRVRVRIGGRPLEGSVVEYLGIVGAYVMVRVQFVEPIGNTSFDFEVPIDWVERLSTPAVHAP